MRKIRAASAAVVGVVTFCPVAALAATWVSTNGTWGQAGNWNPANVPDTGSETATIPSGIVNLDANYTVGTIAQSGGTVSGAFSLTTATLNWTNGQMSGSGTSVPTALTVTGTATLTGPNNNFLFLNGRTLNLQAATTLSSLDSQGRTLNLLNNALVNNAGTLTVIGNASVTGDSITAFNNSGTVTKTGAGVSTFPFFNNAGTVNANGGTLAFSLQAGTTTGTFNIAGGATLRVSGSGAGGTTIPVSSPFTGTGTVEFGGGLNISAPTSGGARVFNMPVVVSGNDVKFNGTTTLADLTLPSRLNNSVTLGGTGAVTAAKLVWESGIMNDSGTTSVTGPATLSLGGTSLFLDGRTLNLQGPSTLGIVGEDLSNSLLYLRNGGVLNIGGTFALGGTSKVLTNNVGNNAVNNSGTLTKSSGTGTGAMPVFANSGTVNADSGTLALALRSGGTSTGDFNTADGAALSLSSPTAHTLTAAADIGGSGRVDVTGGTINLQGSRTIANPVRIAGGTLAIGAASDTFASIDFLGGRLDVGTGVVTVNDGGGIFSVLAAKNLIVAGGNGGSGYFTSAADADHRLGYGDTGSTIKVRYTFNGDADLDGGVSINDFNALAGNFGKANGQNWAGGDFDYDGGVSINDFNLLAGQFGKTLASPSATVDFSGLLAFAAAHDDLVAFEAITGVPEPTVLATLGVAGVLGLRRRTARRDER